MTKTHWFVSIDHPRFDSDLRALCGAIVRNAQPVPAVWDRDDPQYGLVKCRECDRRYQETCSPVIKYVAVICEGQEAINAEAV